MQNQIQKEKSTVFNRDVCGAVWFGFEVKSHPNRNVKMYAVWFSSVDF